MRGLCYGKKLKAKFKSDEKKFKSYCFTLFGIKKNSENQNTKLYKSLQLLNFFTAFTLSNIS